MTKAEAIEAIIKITKECPDVTVKVLTLDDVFDFTGLSEEHTKRIRASYVWKNWALFNEFDVEDIHDIRHEIAIYRS